MISFIFFISSINLMILSVIFYYINKVPGILAYLIYILIFSSFIGFTSYLQYTGKRYSGSRTAGLNPRKVGIMIGLPLTVVLPFLLIDINLSRDYPKGLVLPIVLLLISGILSVMGGILSEKILSGYEKYIKKD